MISALLEAGADPTTRDAEGRTPLHWTAVYSANAEAVTLLVTAGAGPNARDNDGRPPLAHLLGTPTPRNLAVIRAFMAAGADPDGRNTTIFGQSFRQRAATNQEILAAINEGIAAFNQKEEKAAAAQKKQVEAQVLAAQVSCDKWNTREFLRHAETADVSRCLKTKDPNARDDKGRTPLHTAAMVSKEPAVVAALAKAGAELDARDGEGRTPLHLAALFGKSPAIVTALVKSGADIDGLDGKGRTALELAEKFSDTPALVSALRKAKDAPVASAAPGSLLLCEKWNTAAFFKDASLADLSLCLETEDPDARSENGRTPLHYAAQGSAPAFVTVLAKAGAEVNARDKRGGWTPLHLAAWFGKSRTVVQSLLDAGADPEAKDDTGRTPWHYLKENPALKDFDPRVATVSCEDWNTALFFERASAADVSRCLKGGAKVNAHDETGATPLHVAAASKNSTPAVVQALLDAGADREAKDESGKTAADYARVNPALEETALAQRPATGSCEDWNSASFFEHAETADVSRCLENGASVRARDASGATPLHFAARHGTSAAVVTALVGAGARVSARDETGATPLHSATASSVRPAVVEALLDAGADPAARDEAGKTPAHYLKDNPALRGTSVFGRLAGVSCEDWNTASFFERAETAEVSRCLKDGAEVDARDDTEATPLHLAAEKTDVPAVVQVLLDAGADPAARDSQGKAPWDYAKTNPALKGAEVYWQLNEGRFQ